MKYNNFSNFFVQKNITDESGSLSGLCRTVSNTALFFLGFAERAGQGINRLTYRFLESIGLFLDKQVVAGDVNLDLRHLVLFCLQFFYTQKDLHAQDGIVELVQFTHFLVDEVDQLLVDVKADCIDFYFNGCLFYARG